MKNIQQFFSILIVCALIAANLPAPVQARDQNPITQYNQVIATFNSGNLINQLGVGNSGLLGDNQDLPATYLFPDGPQSLLYNQNTFYILDAMNNRIIHFDPVSQHISIINTQMDGYFSDMQLMDGYLYINNLAENYVARAELEVEPQVRVEIASSEETVGLFDANVTFDGTTAEVNRLNDHQQFVAVFNTDDVLLSSFMVETDHFLGSVRYYGQDTLGNFYVLIEEVLENVPAIVAEVSIRRYSPDAIYLDAAVLPLEDIYFLPNRPVAVDPDGGAYFLSVQKEKTQILKLGFNPSYTSKLEENGEIILSEQLDEFPFPQLDNTISAVSPVTRQQVIQSAEAYLHVGWTLRPENYYSGPANNWDNCSGGGVIRENWRLPRYLANRVNQVIQEVPYAWGGYQSISNFTNRLNQGNWAGNICGQEVRNNVAGVDCSGFVSQVLQLGGHYTTTTLGQMANRIDWSQLRAGDFLMNGGHVMLFEKFDNGRNVDGGVWVYESTMRNGVDRVIYNKVTFSYLSTYKYVPWRAKNIIEDTPVVGHNLVRNGGFSNGVDQWGFWEINYSNRDGALYTHLNTSSLNGGSVYQDLNYALESNFPMELSLSLGNISATDKVFSISLHSTDTWNGALGCSFTVPANTDFKNYRLVAKVPARWSNARFEFAIATADGQPSLIVDNINVQYRPDLNPTTIECTVQDTPPAYNIIIDHYVTGTGWVKVDTENPVYCSQNQNNLYYNRTNRNGDVGAAYWLISVNRDAYYEVFAYMPYYGHYMAVTPHARYWVEYEGMPVGGPSNLVVLDQNQNLCSWVSLGVYRYIPGEVYGVYMGTGWIPTNITVPNLIAADRVMVVPVGNPDNTLPDGTLTSPANGSVINRGVPSTTVNLSADAWDNSSGVSRVEFHVRYDGEWHTIGTDYSAPYAMQWNVPRNISPQELTFTIHVIDRTGNESIDPGGYRISTYKLADINTGFVVGRDGYSFGNWNGPGELWTDFTKYDFIDMVGRDRACWAIVAGICIEHAWVIPQYMRAIFNLSTGHCQGMSITSQRFFKNYEDPSDFQPSANQVADLSVDTLAVRRYISWFQARQMYDPVYRYNEIGAFGTPTEELMKLYDAISSQNGDWPSITVRHNFFESTGLAHAVTPIAIEDQGNGIYKVYIYDNEQPNNNDAYIEVDTNDNKWKIFTPLMQWNGDAESRSFGMVPMSEFGQPIGDIGLLPSGIPIDLNLADGSQAVNLWVGGTSNILVTDESGRRLGFSDGIFYDEILESQWVVFPGGTSGTANPDIFLPAYMDYEVEIQGNSISANQAMSEDPIVQSISFARFGTESTILVKDLTPETNSPDFIYITAEGDSVKFTPGSEDNHPDLMIAEYGDMDEMTVTVENVGSSTGEPIVFVKENGRYKLDYSQAGEGLYNIKIVRLIDDQEQIFVHTQVLIELGNIHYLDIENWDGNGSLPLLIDQDGDGDIDQTVMLINQRYQIYLPVLIR